MCVCFGVCVYVWDSLAEMVSETDVILAVRGSAEQEVAIHSPVQHLLSCWRVSLLGGVSYACPLQQQSVQLKLTLK